MVPFIIRKKIERDLTSESSVKEIDDDDDGRDMWAYLNAGKQAGVNACIKLAAITYC